MDAATDGRLRFGFPVRQACTVRADERLGAELLVENQNQVGFSAPPRGIVSVLLRP
jgi:hypothetical protein